MDPNLMLMMMGDESGSTDLLPLIFMQGNQGSDITENKRMQMMFFGPIAKKMLKRLSKKIEKLSEKKRAELLAGLVASEMSKRSEGDLAQLLNLATTSILMSFFGSAASQPPSLAPASEGNESLTENENKRSELPSGETGGAFLCFEEEPKETAKKTPITIEEDTTEKTKSTPKVQKKAYTPIY